MRCGGGACGAAFSGAGLASNPLVRRSPRAGSDDGARPVPAAVPNPASITVPGDVGLLDVGPALPNPTVATTLGDGRSVPGRGLAPPAGTSNAPTLGPPTLISGAFAVGASNPAVRTSRTASDVRTAALLLGKAPTIIGAGLGADGIGRGAISVRMGAGSRASGSILACGILRTVGGGASSGGGGSRSGTRSIDRGARSASTGTSRTGNGREHTMSVLDCTVVASAPEVSAERTSAPPTIATCNTTLTVTPAGDRRSRGGAASNNSLIGNYTIGSGPV